MTRRNEATQKSRDTQASDRLEGKASGRAASASATARDREWITFVSDGEERRVDLNAPRARRRKGRTMVHLMDLWVASLLPGDFLDLRFEIVTTGSGGAVRCSHAIEALEFSRGTIDVDSHTLSWDTPGGHLLNGLRALSIVVIPTASSQVVSIKPIASPATVASTKPTVHRISSVADLQRLLPYVPRVYPKVELRLAPAEGETRRAG